MKNIMPNASISFDLDNKWSFLKTHGDDGWETFPSYFDILIPRVLDFLAAHELKITFFIVGQDAALPKNEQWLRQIAAAGHEIGNHSFKHEPWLHLYSQQEIEADLEKAEKHIIRVTGKKPVGFRGPGFSLSLNTLDILCSQGYLYDCSTFPTFLAPLARAYYFIRTHLSSQEKEKRNKLFGTFRDGFRSIQAYRWQLKNNRSLLEIPITTMPFLKTPIHISYLLFLGKFSPFLARMYFRLAMILCRLTGTQPSLLLHPLDFLDRTDTPRLDFFPAMDVPADKKITLIEDVLAILGQYFKPVTLEEYAREISRQEEKLTLIDPSFSEV